MNARGAVRIRLDGFGDQHHLAGELRIGLGIAQRAADIFAEAAAGVAEGVAAGHRQKRHIRNQLAALHQLHAAAVRMDFHRLLHMPLRNKFTQLAAQAGCVDFAHHAVLNVAD